MVTEETKRGQTTHNDQEMLRLYVTYYTGSSSFGTRDICQIAYSGWAERRKACGALAMVCEDEQPGERDMEMNTPYASNIKLFDGK